ncbi:hypothetical protein [Streptomyces globisporus]|uniref:hypothetical protein n=1 Tax=Streptomyces globisporus TaxID=1908 RepID=UPI0004C4CE12|nr:hypothetical protein [Streptomyces globisporus]
MVHAREHERDRRHRPARTTPAHAMGESGDREARKEAEETVTARAGDTGPEGADGHRDKRRRPGVGREEQTEERR